MALTSTIIANLTAVLTGPVGGLGVASARHTLDTTVSLADGTGASQASKVWSRSAQSLVLSGTETWDLAGSLTDAFGAAVVFSKVKAIYIKAAAANTNNVIVGGAANAVPIFGGATHTIAVKPGGVFLYVDPSAAGVAVGAGATDELLITNSGAGTAVVYDIVILGS